MSASTTPQVLVTRSAPGGLRLCREIESLGLVAVPCPAVVLAAPEHPEQLRRAITKLPPPDGVIVTSPAGLVEAVQLLGPGWFCRQPLVVPGETTADRARALGITGVYSPPGSGDSEAMLNLPQLDQVSGQRWFILAAEGGRRLLETVLSQRGATVTRHHVYRRLAAPLTAGLLEALDGDAPLVVLLASAAALTWMQTMLDGRQWSRVIDQPVIAPSKRVAAQARTAGCRHVLQAEGADDRAMLTALVQVINRGGFG